MSRMFSMMTRNFLEVEGDLYEIKKILAEGSSNIPTEMWKEYLGAEKVFRKENLLYFVVKVEEAEIIEETSNKA